MQLREEGPCGELNIKGQTSNAKHQNGMTAPRPGIERRFGEIGLPFAFVASSRFSLLLHELRALPWFNSGAKLNQSVRRNFTRSRIVGLFALRT